MKIQINKLYRAELRHGLSNILLYFDSAQYSKYIYYFSNNKIFLFFFESFMTYPYLMNEAQLIAKAKAGDFEAFTELINTHKQKIYALAIKLAGNKQDAEDIVQDTLLKAIDKIDQFREEASFGTWLYSIALNEGRAHLGKQKHSELKPIESYLPGGGNVDMHKSDSQHLFDWKDPHEILENNELETVIGQAIEELPYKYRAPFLLRYHEELSIKEIADIIGETVAATKSRVLRARLALRDYLSNKFEERYERKVS
ncbi:MAG: RNA polymerase subunit sigma-70 [Candidatus Zixiibacteriota bacterium]|nr:MAG: RNA polymerase subunit sigma-70 [candidate division Zixibacteria bacterium]